MRQRSPGAILIMESDSRLGAFRELYDRYYRSVVAFLVRFGFAREDARELAQDVFVRVYRHMDTYRGEAPWSYLRQTARRLALNEVRRRKTKRRAGELHSPGESEEAEVAQATQSATSEAASTPEEELLQEQQSGEHQRRRQRLSAAIAALPDGSRQCLLLWLGGLKYHQVAANLGITVDAVKSRLHDARLRLRERLREEPTGLDWPEPRAEDDDDRQE